MKQDLRPLIAHRLHQVKAYSLPSVCQRYGLELGDHAEAFASKRQYVLSRLAGLPDQQVLQIAKAVLETYFDDTLQAAVEQADQSVRLISELTRRHLVEALDQFQLSSELLLSS
jgi:hypothetical protein